MSMAMSKQCVTKIGFKKNVAIDPKTSMTIISDLLPISISIFYHHQYLLRLDIANLNIIKQRQTCVGTYLT